MARKKLTTTYTTDDGRTVERSATRRIFGRVELKPSGRYRASFPNPGGGKPIAAPSTFATKTDAAAWLDLQRIQIERGEWRSEQVTEKHEKQATAAETLGAYGARWIDGRLTSKGLPLRASTKQGYRNDLAQLGALNDRPLTAITPAMIETWYKERIATGKVTSASHSVSLLTSILESAYEQDLIKENPCKRARTRRPLITGAANARTGRKADTPPPTEAELAIIAANTPARYRALVSLAAWSALRFGEQTELRRKDLDDDGEIIVLHVRRGVTHTTDEGCVIGEPKTAKSKRDIPLPPGVSRTLRDHLAEFVPPGPDALIFAPRETCHLKMGTQKFWWYQARAAAGRPDLSWHDLRHFGLTRKARQDATLAELMYYGGHSVVSTAMRYQHDADMERHREQARRMGA